MSEERDFRFPPEVFPHSPFQWFPLPSLAAPMFLHCEGRGDEQRSIGGTRWFFSFIFSRTISLISLMGRLPSVDLPISFQGFDMAYRITLNNKGAWKLSMCYDESRTLIHFVEKNPPWALAMMKHCH